MRCVGCLCLCVVLMCAVAVTAGPGQSDPIVKVQQDMPADSVHLMSAARVLDGNLNELVGWRVSVDLDKDIKDGFSNTSYVVDFSKLRLDGVPYTSKGIVQGYDPALEVLGWYALNYPVMASKDANGVLNLIPMRGETKKAYMIGVKQRHKVGPWVEPESSKYNNPTLEEIRNIWRALPPIQPHDPRDYPINPPTEPIVRGNSGDVMTVKVSLSCSRGVCVAK